VTNDTEEDVVPVLEGGALPVGELNTPDTELVAHIAHSIRLQHKQVAPQRPQADRICLVGGGPSLAHTERELRDMYFAGAKIVTMNGAYHWCIERNLRPSAQIVLDARPSMARFVEPVIPQCKYLLASQCHPETWAAVDGRPDVWIWHAVGPENNWRAVLDEYYLGKWQSIVGGVTVATRAIALMRIMGFLRMDLFGVDSCWMGEAHHAYEQAENERDERIPVYVYPTGHRDQAKLFWCSRWHAKQLEDLLKMIRNNGEKFLLNIHGEGLLAYALRSAASVEIMHASV
jgi:hypothetical protein